MEKHVYSVFGGDAEERDALLRRDAARVRGLLYLIAPLGALIVSWGSSVMVRLGANETALFLPAGLFTGFVLGIVVAFHADDAARAFPRMLRAAWFLYAALAWVFGLAWTISFRDALTRLTFH